MDISVIGKHWKSSSFQPDLESLANLQRRMFLARAVRYAVGITTIAALPLYIMEHTSAAQIAADDLRIRSERVALDADWGKLACYFTRPNADTGRLPGVIISHDKWGLTPHFEDVARRLALEGFVALAPDYASRFGGTPTESGPALEVVGMVTKADMDADTQAALLWLKSNGKSSEKVGAVGFGLGATAIDAAVTKEPALNGAVIFYGHPPPLADVGNIKAPLMLNLAGKDQFVGPEVPAFVDAVKKANVKAEIFTYENTERGFDDDSDSAHYSAEAAKLAWSRTIEFLKATLS
ncbi:MAG: dienelactone hydrolase family protein [Phyllobacterium sp.]|uniref:dienelactone hydrolase family protein n=1 Tax=Phyllobacterium sp. TaxID=1871046 RepID=UPI0030F1399E